MNKHASLINVLIWLITACSNFKLRRISLNNKSLKVRSHYAIVHVCSSNFFSFDLLSTNSVTYGTLDRKSKARSLHRLEIWKWIKFPHDSVRFSDDFLVRIKTSSWIFPVQWINSIGWKLVVKSYIVATSKIDSNRLTWASCDRYLSKNKFLNFPF